MIYLYHERREDSEIFNNIMENKSDFTSPDKPKTQSHKTF